MASPTESDTVTSSLEGSPTDQPCQQDLQKGLIQIEHDYVKNVPTTTYTAEHTGGKGKTEGVLGLTITDKEIPTKSQEGTSTGTTHPQPMGLMDHPGKEISENIITHTAEDSKGKEGKEGLKENLYAQQKKWEMGQVDYLKVDSFENIQKHLSKVINSKGEMDDNSDQNANDNGALTKSPPVSSFEERQKWETGQIDYLGKDSYDNIAEHITKVLKGKGKKQEAEGKKSAKPEVDVKKKSYFMHLWSFVKSSF